MTLKVNGFAFGPNQSVSGGMKFYTVTAAALDLTAAAVDGTSDLDRLVRALSTRAQPVILGVVGATALRIAVEHNEVFGDLAAFEAEVSASMQTAVTVVEFTL